MTTPTEQFTYHTLDVLQAMSLAEVEALWELVPTERQRLYKAIYDRTRRDEGASGSDTLETQMVAQLLTRYADKGLVPVGSYWVPVPPQIQAAAKDNTPLERGDLPTVSTTKLPMPMLFAGIGCVILLGFLLLRGMSTGHAARSGTKTLTATPTLARTYTPTPFALDAQDAIIQGGTGNSSANAVYPVNLRMVRTGETQPRIFVVQRRIVQTAEWQFTDNPDVASYIAGLIVKPVIGIPWSDANASLFQNVRPGDAFLVQMNTGAALRFTFSERRTINRGDTSLFQQDAPGLVIVLFGQRDPATNDTPADRLILLADYTPSDTNAMNMVLPTALPSTPTLTPTPVERVDVQIISLTMQPDTLTVRLRLFNGRYEPLTLDASTIWLSYGYAERPVGPHIAAQLEPLTIVPGQAADVSIVFAWHGEPFAMLSVLDEYLYAVTVR